MITLLYGEDDFLQSKELTHLKTALGDREMADLNTTWLDGRRATVAEVQAACDALPFLTERRLVVVEGLLSRLRRRRKVKEKVESEEDGGGESGSLQNLLDYVERVPETTDLVFIEPVKAKEINTTKAFKHLAALAREGRARMAACTPPQQRELAQWIVERAKEKGARIAGDAAQELANAVGAHLRLLDQELEKLSTYALDRPITPQDVRLLVAATREANVFHMVEALGRGDRQVALKMLRELHADGEASLKILGMIARHFRQLLQAKDLTVQGLNAGEVARQMHLQNWQADRALRQARRFTIPQLEAVFDHMLETDVAIKTGRMADQLAMEMLVMTLTMSSQTSPVMR